MELIPPHERATTVGRAGVEAQLRAAMAADRLTNGWMLCGARGSGKATLAYRIARGLLGPEALKPGESLDMDNGARAFRLIAARGHPDLFVAERLFDEKNDRYAAEITVETIRELSAFLSKTASEGGWRIAIVDSADELNRNAANALLKSLEEPPAKTLLLLLASEPGRLLPTVRSRCRRIILHPLPDDEIVGLLKSEAELDEAQARAISRVARGRPGYALALAAGEGGEAAALADDFLRMVLERRDPMALSAAFAGKAGARKWEIFIEILLQRLSEAARASARTGERALGAFATGELVEAHARMAALAARGEALNVDRGQILFGLARELKAA
jgi:DNA polymerase-3 subunit delta'